MIEIRKAIPGDISTIQQITYATWPETYKTILSTEQVEYMLNLIYSREALTKQIKEEGHEFILAYENEVAIAFADYAPMQPGIYKLHKLYALRNQQGKGLGKLLINYIIEEIKPNGATALRLNVNRYNKARQFYEHLGFAVIYEEDIDIGNGYFMNDFVMEKKLFDTQPC